jgi:hypothetical protein
MPEFYVKPGDSVSFAKTVATPVAPFCSILGFASVHVLVVADCRLSFIYRLMRLRIAPTTLLGRT